MIDKEKVYTYSKKIADSKNRIFSRYGFFGLLLSHMSFAVDTKEKTVSTDGVKIYFNPRFLEKLSSEEMDFILLHQIIHVALGHCWRGEGYEKDAFDKACDIVVNSNIIHELGLDVSKLEIVGKEVEYRTPNGAEGYLFSAEDVYLMMQKASAKKGEKEDRSNKKFSDDHSRWNDNKNDSEENDKSDDEMAMLSKRRKKQLQLEWEENVVSAAMTAQQCNMYLAGKMPAFAERLLKSLTNPQVDWREILIDFVQEEVCDYSFVPPDRRFADSDFLMPDFNDTDISPKNILFMIDTSASITANMMTTAYSEILGAIEQFNGRLEGRLGFFDTIVIEPKPFVSEDEFKKIIPKGGGGTNFFVIFKYVFEYMENLPYCIIIMTDGYAPFPEEKMAQDIPVLWLINNEKVTPPWGRIARFKVENSRGMW